MTKTPTKEEKRDQRIETAISYMLEVISDAEMRGMSAADVAVSFAGLIAGRNASLTGECLVALRIQIQRAPVTKIIAAKGELLQ